MRSVLIGIPTMGTIHPMLVPNLIQWGKGLPDCKVSFYFTYHVAPVDRARNQIVEYFLKGSFTHLFFIDSDTIPPRDALERLLSHDKDIVSGLTPILRLDPKEGLVTHDNCFTHKDIDPNGNVEKTHIAIRNTGLKEIFRCGAACLLIKRGVFETLSKPYFTFIYNADGTEHTRSEDINFCDKAIEHGFEIYADTDVVCQHSKEAVL